MKKRKDNRPICHCAVYKFPHKIGGKCKGIVFATFYFYNDGDLCEQCNLYRDDQQPKSCDAINGTESINKAECYRERLHSFPAEKLPLQLELDNENDTT